MINKVRLFLSENTNPYAHLEFEEKLLEQVTDDEYIIMFYYNRPSVILGRFQLPWREINIQNCESIDIARRKSGGGCVYHDLGNLNFFFLSAKKNYRKEWHYQHLLRTLNRMGAHIEQGEKDDLLCKGRKITGSAFRHGRTASYHHGTLLFNADLKALENCLKPFDDDWETKAICSRRAHVMNLNELGSQFTIENFLREFQKDLELFCKDNGMELLKIQVPTLDDVQVNKVFTYIDSPSFKVRKPIFDGELEISIQKGRWESLYLKSSVLHLDLVQEYSAQLKGEEFSLAKIKMHTEEMSKKWTEYQNEFDQIYELIRRTCF